MNLVISNEMRGLQDGLIRSILAYWFITFFDPHE